jgi:hypothetical protein
MNTCTMLMCENVKYEYLHYVDIGRIKEKIQKDKQRPTKHTHKTKDRVTRTSLKMM